MKFPPIVVTFLLFIHFTSCKKAPEFSDVTESTAEKSISPEVKEAVVMTKEAKEAQRKQKYAENNDIMLDMFTELPVLVSKVTDVESAKQAVSEMEELSEKICEHIEKSKIVKGDDDDVQKADEVTMKRMPIVNKDINKFLSIVAVKDAEAFDILKEGVNKFLQSIR